MIWYEKKLKHPARTCSDCGKKFKKRKELIKHGRVKHDWKDKKGGNRY